MESASYYGKYVIMESIVQDIILENYKNISTLYMLTVT